MRSSALHMKRRYEPTGFVRKELFKANGCELPQIVFRTVANRRRQVPVTVNGRGVAPVSGCTPRIFSMIMEGEMDLYGFMMSVIGSGRYAPIAA